MNNKQKGALGELLAARFLAKRGYLVLSQNYRRKWGELDIIAQKDGVLHFVEVKSVSRPVLNHKDVFHSPEENVHAFKIRQIRKMIKTYFAEQGIADGTGFQFHVLCVYLDFSAEKARIKWIRDVIL